MKIINLREHTGRAGEWVFCGRPSVFGNPCSRPGVACPVCGRVHFGPGMRQLTACRSIDCYRKWLWAELQQPKSAVRDAILGLRPSDTLACYCTSTDRPATVGQERCHCEVIVRAYEWLSRERGTAQTS